MAASDLSQINALDPNSLSGLRRLSKENSPEAAREAAKQFEALFMQQVLKSMRDASPKGGMFDSEESRMYQSMLDQQLSLQLSTRSGGIGLAKVIERQLSAAREAVVLPDGPVPLNRPDKTVPLDPAIKRNFDAAAPAEGNGGVANAAAATGTASGAANAPAKTAVSAASAGLAAFPGLPAGAGPRAFVEKIWPQAVEASRVTGVPARFLVAQAALETGWGKHELKNADGSPSYNLFNIKAGRNWTGSTLGTTTTEFRDGAATRENARFRAYGSYAESFQDYARMIRNNPRYAAVAGQGDAVAFARGLQSAGYATDPMYADKLARIINGNTLRTALIASATPRA
ncbi:flagellar assembly peptidoglycan hydrolase FlgJ [Zoogloea sp.]|uniref:flagellar assembly peptidoglycan hydrolase FlgJ n=1 Tax=Zoogloea sp. TaxID=49181 RepID=UPI001416225E|nr:MAG: flagellar assembly peptidoglycan hydrolase FlgJ [Zoogloea sp.]